MKKTGLKAILFTIICTMIFAGTAFANSATDHVSVAPNGKGDVLIFPAYFTGSGWETKLVVTNSSLTDSVVAKVVIRSKENSQELRDFMIFLSPADVWTGTLYMAADGRPHIRSTDDSCLNSPTTFATTAAPFDDDLQNTCSGDENELGYVVITEGATFNVAPNQPGVLKADILTAYNNWAATAQTPENVLAGQQEVTNSGAGIAYALNATTLKNYDWNIANQLTIAQETFLGQGGNNTAGEIEAALAKNNVVVPYYAQALGSVFSITTFPTKQAGYPCSQTRTSWTDQFVGFPSPQYTLSAYDLSEDTVDPTGVFVSPQPQGTVSSFPSEVNFLSVTDLPGTFDEGWMHIVGNAYTTNTVTQNSTPFTYTGLPMINSSMRFDSAGNAGWLYNAHSNGVVDFNTTGTADTTEEMNYQYYGQTDN